MVDARPVLTHHVLSIFGHGEVHLVLLAFLGGDTITDFHSNLRICIAIVVPCSRLYR